MPIFAVFLNIHDHAFIHNHRPAAAGRQCRRAMRKPHGGGKSLIYNVLCFIHGCTHGLRALVAPLLLVVMAVVPGCQSESPEPMGERVTVRAEVAPGPRLRVYDPTLEFPEWVELPLDDIQGFTPSTIVGTAYSLLCLRTVAQAEPTPGYAYSLVQVLDERPPSLPSDEEANGGYDEQEEL